MPYFRFSSKMHLEILALRIWVKEVEQILQEGHHLTRL